MNTAEPDGKGNHRKIKFEPEGLPPINAVVLVADLEGFSTFFTQPDVQLYVPKFLNKVFSGLDTAVSGGNASWLDAKYSPLQELPLPIHSKFLGDGALFIWKYGARTGGLSQTQLNDLIYRLYVFALQFPNFLDTFSDEIPLVDVPKRIRFGLASGSVYQLKRQESSEEEYVGYAINLAARLQNYCNSISMIYSARLDADHKELKSSGFVCKIAKKIKGFSKEKVYILEKDFDSIEKTYRNEIFE